MDICVVMLENSEVIFYSLNLFLIVNSVDFAFVRVE